MMSRLCFRSLLLLSAKTKYDNTSHLLSSFLLSHFPFFFHTVPSFCTIPFNCNPCAQLSVAFPFLFSIVIPFLTSNAIFFLSSIPFPFLSSKAIPFFLPFHFFSLLPVH